MFNLKKEILEFNHKKQCGLWLILIGIVLIVSIICGGKFFVNPWMALETDMVGCTDGNINTFLLVVLYTWLEYDSARKCMYNYRNNRLYVSKYTSFSYLHCRCDS